MPQRPPQRPDSSSHGIRLHAAQTRSQGPAQPHRSAQAVETELPIIPVLPVSIADTTTGIWGYNGIFPGPVIHAQRGRRVVLRLRNGLAVPNVNHLHGGHTPPESDGYPGRGCRF